MRTPWAGVLAGAYLDRTFPGLPFLDGVWGAEDPAEAADDSGQSCWAGVGQKT